ncbi:MAG: hypothetical protein NTW32_02655 [Chloroflexi bacterium]|nr:hypothetical protein [Chloroflexota bacterium]
MAHADGLGEGLFEALGNFAHGQPLAAQNFEHGAFFGLGVVQVK